MYDTEIDNFIFYDFGVNQIPVDVSWDPTDPRLVFIETEGLASGGDETN